MKKCILILEVQLFKTCLYKHKHTLSVYVDTGILFPGMVSGALNAACRSNSLTKS